MPLASEKTMFNRYYRQELSYLRELAVEFSRVHPALALIASGLLGILLLR